MRTFEVHGVEIHATASTVCAFVGDPCNLPRWAAAFCTADHERAELRTPRGTVAVGLRTDASEAASTVDWRLAFPDGTVALAQSRVTETMRGSSIYSFVLHAPPSRWRSSRGRWPSRA
jgi:hypothetical protein